MSTPFAAALAAALLASAAAAEPPPAPKAAPPDWKADPVCQMVFFAVMEGLYADGVPTAVADSVVPRAADGSSSVKASFVIECPLCHPVYEAFALYQRRPTLAGGLGDTFGAGIDPDLQRELMSPTVRVRLTALQVLVKRWVERRLAAMRLTEAERADWAAKLNQRSNEGKKRLGELIASDPSYKGWSWYWGCAACNGATRAPNNIRGIVAKP